jgi:hypothetical protein
MRLRKREVKRVEKRKKLLKLKPAQSSEVVKFPNDSEPGPDRVRRGRKPKRLVVIEKEHEESKLSGEHELHCSEKPMLLGLVVKDEPSRVDIV